ncbi:MAG: GntR family transcriptional regulator, partial [Deinococcota bacterium]
MHLAPLTTFSSKKEAVYASLRTAIFQGEFQPGERLVIDTLAKTLGVSAIPVREALQLLQADGLVDIKPHVGASVTTINPDMIYEVFKPFPSLLSSGCSISSLLDLAQPVAQHHMRTSRPIGW